MTILFIPNLLPDGNGSRVSYFASIEAPSHLKDQSIPPDPNGCYQIDSNRQVLFRRIGSPFAKFHVTDTGTSAHIRLEMLDGKRNKRRGNFIPEDNYIEPLGVFHWQPGNKEIER